MELLCGSWMDEGLDHARHGVEAPVLTNEECSVLAIAEEALHERERLLAMGHAEVAEAHPVEIVDHDVLVYVGLHAAS